MAPPSPPKRVTRARAAAKTSSVGLDAPPRKLGSTRVTKSAVKRTKSEVETIIANTLETETEPTPTTRAATRSNVGNLSTSLAAAPRRRVKVTPLDAPVVAEPPVESEPLKKTSTTRTKKTTTAVEKAQDKSSTTKHKSKKSSETEKDVTRSEDGRPRLRGRPKKEASQVVNQVQPEPITRRTRSYSHSSTIEVVQQDVPVTRPNGVTKKKVTFEDLPEDDKENQYIAPKKATSKKPQEAPSTGIHAKPVRKTTTAGARRKANGSDTTRAGGKKPLRVLTPKKVTQVARSSSPNDTDEDELNGGKTSVRDLSLSPKRLPRAVIPLSPVKKLDFNTALLTQALDKKEASDVLNSPPRRPAQSTLSNDLKSSPKRPETGIVFPAISSTLDFLPPPIDFTITKPTDSALLQSPKRGLLNMSAFGKPAVFSPKSSFKSSLLQSPAKRPASPLKKDKLPAKPGKYAHRDIDDSVSIEDIAVTSHFRQTGSPQRSAKVHKLSEEELTQEMGNVDFDESLLGLRSPLKVVKATPLQVHDVNTADFASIRKSPSRVSENANTSSSQETDRTSEVQAFPRQPYQPRNSEDEIALSPILGGDSVTPQKCSESEEDHLHQEINFPEEETAAPMPSAVSPTKTYRDCPDLSEDELANERTPEQAIDRFRSSLTGATFSGRQPFGFRSGAQNAFGFTPLATQLDVWQAGSPEKRLNLKKYPARSMFSPVAAQHIPGEIQISRQSTPQQSKMDKMKTPHTSRKSLAKRYSAAPSIMDSAQKSSEFAEQMAARDFEAQIKLAADADQGILDSVLDQPVVTDKSITHDEQPISPAPISVEESDAARISSDEDNSDDEIDNNEPGELTTDLIKFTHASDTAMVDFAKLAQEADVLAHEVGARGGSEHEEDNAASDDLISSDAIPEVTESELPETETVISTSVLHNDHFEIEADRDMIERKNPNTDLVWNSIESVTPIRTNNGLLRYVNTVCRVPLRPEGEISPIRMPKKRSRSVSAGPASSKRISLGQDNVPSNIQSTPVAASPGRRARSAAPSPGWSTPGQTSFAVSDFGDDTLDDIEIPEDELVDTEQENEGVGTVATSYATPSRAELVTQPVSQPLATPSRTPLRPVGNGVLHGATVFVDVHTTEGADASGIFIELLTQMGAKCVREWRWNPRASVGSVVNDNSATPGKIGITHVVFKDGGKRTLDKVREAKGEVWCVGVAWVLECERQSKWLDETLYLVDSSIIPRGGSRRRKSMEPRALLNENGILSASKSGRRSVSTPMTKQIQHNLLKNTAKDDQYFVTSEGRKRLSESSVLAEDETEISSTYNSPSMTMTTQVLLGYARPEPSRLRDVETEEGDDYDNDEDDEGAGNETFATDADLDDRVTPTTPTMGIVEYDPRTAMTPTTPYFVQQGKKLIQMTCPPKPKGENLFGDPSAGENSSKAGSTSVVELNPEAANKFRLNVENGNRRKTLSAVGRTTGRSDMDYSGGLFTPKVRSPLGKGL